MRLPAPQMMCLIALLMLAPAITQAHLDCDNGPCPAETYPAPSADRLAPNPSLMGDRVYRRVPDGVSLQFFDAPGGSLVHTWKAGDNYVTVYETQGEWARVTADWWVHTAQIGTAGVVISSFTGLLIEDTQPYPIAWSLVNQYASKAPGQNPSESSRYLYRYDTVYIFETVQDAEGYNWYKVDEDAWVHQFRVAIYDPLPERPAEAQTERWVGIDLYEQVLIAYEGDTPVFTTLVSSGLPWWATREGLFHVTLMNPREDMTQDLPDDFYYLQEVPWTAFFDRGIALHGTYWHDGFGYPQSHGCVNLSITDAHWLYEFLSPEFDWENWADGGAAVYVYSTDPFRAS